MDGGMDGGVRKKEIKCRRPHKEGGGEGGKEGGREGGREGGSEGREGMTCSNLRHPRGKGRRERRREGRK